MTNLTKDQLNRLIAQVDEDNQYNDGEDKEFWQSVSDTLLQDYRDKFETFIASPSSLPSLTDIEGYLADNHTHLSEEQIKDVSPTIQGKLSYEGIYTQIDSLVLYLLGNLGDSEQTPPE